MNQAPHATIKVRFAGKYRCVLNEGTDREVSTPWFDNLITNIGLDRLGNSTTTVFTWASIGTGTTTPAFTDTSLAAFTASTSTITLDSQTNQGPSTYIAQCQFHHTYAQGAVVGNMAEVGVGWATGGGSLWSRALILDGGGSPTTLTVTALDQLTVYYQLTMTPDLTDLSSTVSISGTTYNYTGRIATVATWMASFYTVFQSGSPARWATAAGGSGFPLTSYSTQTLGAITSTPAGTASNGGTNSIGTYTTGNRYLDNTITVSPSQCNSSGGVGSFVVHFNGGTADWQYSLANASGGAVLPKDNTKTWTMVIRFAWDRV